MSLPTPDTSHLTNEDLQHIYEPAEDSFLLLDALETDLEILNKIRPNVCLEIGSGSGVCSTFLAQILGHPTYCMCTDINPAAARLTKRTGRVNGVSLEPIVTDLVAGLESRLAGLVDVLLFNPPYVVTPSHEVGGRGIEAAWAGGERGRKVMDRLFPVVPSLLSQDGVFYLVVIKENNQDEIEAIMSGYGLEMSVVLSRRAGPEFLSVLRFNR